MQLAKDLEVKKTLLERRLENATRLCGACVCSVRIWSPSTDPPID